MSSPSEADRLICFCHHVSHSELIAAIRAGAVTLERIQSDTCASTGCGGCEWEVREILAEELKEIEAEKA